MALSSPGIGSGLDVNGIVNQLVELERRPIALLQTAKSKLSSQLSSVGLLQSYMVNLQSVAGQLAKADFWTRSTATSSDAAAVAVSAKAGAVAGTYSIEVTSLATSQSLSSAVITDPDAVGTGTLTIKRGTSEVAIAIESGANSLEAIRAAINAADAGVSAAIVQDGQGPRLVLTGSKTGVANAVSIQVANATGQLGALAYPGGLTQDRPAADAQLKVNNLAITSASNRLDGTIEGLDLTLAKAGGGAVTVAVSADNAALRKGIDDFVKAYNEVNRFLATQTRYDETSKTAGALQGDRTAVALQNRLRGLVAQASGASAAFARLSDAGLTLQRDGSLKIDETKLTQALASGGELARAFSAPGGFAPAFKALADASVGSEGPLETRADSLRAGIARNDKDQERLEDRVARTRQLLLRQYQALDARMNQLQGLSTYVTQQMDLLGKQYGGKD